MDVCILYFVITKMARWICRHIIPGFLILVVVVVVDVVDLVAAAVAAALGSRLPVVRVCLGEDHLGCFQPAQLGWSTHLACSRPV